MLRGYLFSERGIIKIPSKAEARARQRANLGLESGLVPFLVSALPWSETASKYRENKDNVCMEDVISMNSVDEVPGQTRFGAENDNG